MNVLPDTNVLSEVQRPSPDAKVLTWLDAIDEECVYSSVASIAELRRGVALLDPGRRRAALTNWLNHDLPARFAGRILLIDYAIAEAWWDLLADFAERPGTDEVLFESPTFPRTRALGSDFDGA